MRYTNHARDRMADPTRLISEAEVEMAIAAPDSTVIGPSEVKYDKLIGGRLIRVVVVPDSDPPLVITVYPVRPVRR